MDDCRPVEEALGDGLTLRCAADEDDLERVAALNGAIHGRDDEALTLHLFRYYPGCDLRDLIFVEERRRRGRPGRVVSSLCLIPWTLRYGMVSLPVGEMGLVGTLEEYRQRGLIRAQVRHFNRRLDERGCLISAIQGIPYFYRQFGYEYALPLEAAVQLELRDVPPAGQGDFVFRLATEDDLPTLLRLYNEAVASLSISAQREESTWRYLLRHSAGASTECERWLISDPHGEPVGYVGVARYPVFGQEMLSVSEGSRLGHAAALDTLRFLKGLASERDKVALRLNLPEDCALNAVARALGGHDQGAYAWQIRFPAPAALLQALVPLLEQRLACSSFTGLTRDIRISLYRETLLLRFEDGRLTRVANLGFTGPEEVHLPPQQLVQLVLGHRTFEELRWAYPDVRAAGDVRALVDVLFPRARAFLYSTY